MNEPRGFTLLELLCALALGGILLGFTVPAFRDGRDALAIRAARDELLQAVALTRTLAPLHAGADLVLDTAGANVLVRSGNTVHERIALGERFGVGLRVEGSTQPVTALRFDALGIGRIANRTVLLRRGRARASISLSMYGRPRAW